MPNPAVTWMLLSVWSLLVAASLLVFALVKMKPERNLSELVARTRSWWWMLGIFTTFILLGRNWSIALMGIISFLALKEYFTLIPSRHADRRILFWGYLAIPLQYYWVAIEWYGMFIIFIPVYLFLFMSARLVLAQQTEGFLKSAGMIHWGMMLAVFSLSHAAYLLTLPSQSSGAGLLLYLVFMTQWNDVMQYAWGKKFGKHKIVPLVSPGKTWEGLIGGVLSTGVTSALLAVWLTNHAPWEGFLAGLLIGIGGFLGDITLSAVKRDLGVKDASQLIPGHGGMLDRIDSLTFTAPLFLHAVRYFYF